MIRRRIFSTAAAAGVAVIAWAYPLFHIVPLDDARKSKDQAHVNAADFATKFWNERLTPAWSRAADARSVLATIDGDFQAARTKYGRIVGISNSYFVFVQGSGRVVSVDAKGVGLAIRDSADGPDVVLPTGMVFGNAARDATGLLDMNAFPNSQDFNAISTELNRIVETRVLPELRDRAVVGQAIQFVGCAEVSNDAKRRKPLKVVPLSVRFVKPGQPR
jgi:predicted lipoprotein